MHQEKGKGNFLRRLAPWSTSSIFSSETERRLMSKTLRFWVIVMAYDDKQIMSRNEISRTIETNSKVGLFLAYFSKQMP